MKIDTALWRRLFSWRHCRELALYALIFFVASLIGNGWMTRHQVAGQAPQLNRSTLSGERIELVRNARDGQLNPFPQTTLLYFFADWCPICKLQNDTIAGIAASHRVIGIAMQSGDDGRVNAYARQHGLNFPLINDRDGSLSRAYGVNGVPATVIVDRQGKIRFSTQGYATSAGLLSRLWLAR